MIARSTRKSRRRGRERKKKKKKTGTRAFANSKLSKRVLACVSHARVNSFAVYRSRGIAKNFYSIRPRRTRGCNFLCRFVTNCLKKFYRTFFAATADDGGYYTREHFPIRLFRPTPARECGKYCCERANIVAALEHVYVALAS